MPSRRKKLTVMVGRAWLRFWLLIASSPCGAEPGAGGPGDDLASFIYARIVEGQTSLRRGLASTGRPRGGRIGPGIVFTTVTTVTTVTRRQRVRVTVVTVVVTGGSVGVGATVVVVVGTTVVPPPSQNCSHATRTVCPSYPSAFGALSLQHPQNAVNATQSSRSRCHFPIPGSGIIGPGANTLKVQVHSPRHPPGIVVTVVGVAVVVEVVVVVVVAGTQEEYQ